MKLPPPGKPVWHWLRWSPRATEKQIGRTPELFQRRRNRALQAKAAQCWQTHCLLVAQCVNRIQVGGLERREEAKDHADDGAD